MSSPHSREANQVALDAIPEEDRPLVAERMGIPVEDLVDVAYDALVVHEQIEIERGEGLPPEMVEEWVEHLMCEYT